MTPAPAGLDIASRLQDDVPPDHPLTTKEGWGEFVRHNPGPPALLTQQQILALTPTLREANAEARRNYHADLPLVNTPIIKRLLGTGRLLIQLNRKQISARRGCIVSGASGTGKTTALTQLGRAHELAIRNRYPHDAHRLPVIYVTVPMASTPRMLAAEFARFFGLEFSGRANLTDIVNAVCHLAAHTHVDLVLVDEIHNISLTTRSGAESSDQLKYFAERIRATFFLAGVEVEAQGLFAGPRGRQIAGRFTVIPSTQFAYGTVQQREDWTALVTTMETMLRLHEPAPGTLPKIAENLYQRTGGAIGSLSQLIRGAAVLAIEYGTEHITEDLLDLVPIDYTAHTAYATTKTRTAKKRTPAAEAV